MSGERTRRDVRGTLLAAIVGCIGCATSADWPLSETFTDCATVAEIPYSAPTRRGMVVADLEATSVREDMAPVHARCRDGSMIFSNTWGWRRDRLRVLDDLGESFGRSRIVVFSVVGEFGPGHESLRWPRLVCIEEEDGILRRRESYGVVERVGGGYALPGSEIQLLDAQPSLRSIRAHRRGRRLAIDGVPVSAMSAADLCH